MYEYEQELEAMPELEWEYEGAHEALPEWEYEDEGEAELFFGRLAGLARRAAQSPALRRIGLSAARSALGGLGAAGSALGGAIGGSQGATLGRQLGAGMGNRLNGILPQQEFEDEFEYEYEDEWESEVNPIQKAYPGALMEHLGHAAYQAEHEAEAEAFIGALVPLAARLIPHAAPAIMRAAPGLVRGLAGAARTLRSNPTTRPLVRTLPTVMQRTATALAQQAAEGKPVTPQSAVRTLARQTAQIVSSPQQATQAYRRSRAMDQRYHQQQQAQQEMMY